MELKSILKKRFLDFGGNTSVGGLNNAIHSKSPGKKCYWIIMFVIGAGLTFINLKLI